MNTKKIILSLTSVLICSALSANFSAVYAADESSGEVNKNRDASVTLADIGYTPAEILSNAESGFLFSDQLDENNTSSYKAMEEYLAAMTDTAFTVQLTDSIVLERSSRNMSNWSDEEYTEYAEAILGAVMPGVIAFTLDYPEVFWLNFAEVGCGTPAMSYAYNPSGSKRYRITISQVSVAPNFDTNYTDFDSVLELKKSAEEKLENFTVTGDTDYEKCKSIYESIIDMTEYDVSAPYAHGIAGVLCDGKAVCEGYSKTFKMLCDRENIPCISVLGNYNAENLTAHMWNYVYLDGKWYGCDPTFDESTGNLTYFMRGSEFFNKYHRPESPYSVTVLSFPEISETDYITVPLDTTTTTTETTTTITETTTTETESTTTTETETTTTETTTTTSTTDLAEEKLLGDINGDGEVSIIDMIILRKYLLGIADESVVFSESFDCNEDGAVNIFDAVFLYSLILK